MIVQAFKLFLLCVISLWGCVYVGSLTPKLWRQKNYRGAIGVGIMACLTLVLPTLITLYMNNR